MAGTNGEKPTTDGWCDSAMGEAERVLYVLRAMYVLCIYQVGMLPPPTAPTATWRWKEGVTDGWEQKRKGVRSGSTCQPGLCEMGDGGVARL